MLQNWAAMQDSAIWKCWWKSSSSDVSIISFTDEKILTLPTPKESPLNDRLYEHASSKKTWQNACEHHNQRSASEWWHQLASRSGWQQIILWITSSRLTSPVVVTVTTVSAVIRQISNEFSSNLTRQEHINYICGPNKLVKFTSIFYKIRTKLECGPMPSVMAAQPNIGGAVCESSVIPFLVPRRKVWLTSAVGVPCSNAANIRERKTWTQSEFCTWQNSVRGQEPSKMYIVCQPRRLPKIVQSLVCLRWATSLQ